MNHTSKYALTGLAAALVIGGGAFALTQNSDTPGEAVAQAEALAKANVKQENGQTVKEFTLTAQEKTLRLRKDVKVDAWTYNGTAPGAQIRVTEGDTVRITLQNKLPEPTSIHWHGLPVPNHEDGIPGVTQDAVQPGGSYTYEFTADTPGTYWYHSHQKSAEQVDKGMYGSFIVEPKNPSVKYDQDITLVFDEWMTGTENGGGNSSGMDHSGHNMSGMNNGNTTTSGTDHGGHNMSGMDHGTPGMEMGDASMSHDDMMKQLYNVFTVNGTSADQIQPLQAKKGERVKLRLINAGFQSQLLHLHNQSFTLTHTDGQPVAGGTELRDQLIAVAPGERYEIEFTAGDSFWIDSHTDAPAATGIRIPVHIDGQKPGVFPADAKDAVLPRVDFTTYGQHDTTQSEAEKFDLSYTLDLNNVMQHGQGEVYTINGKTYPDTDPITVQEGDRVKVKFTNRGTSDHPMHLHGHFFQVIGKNGQPATGAPIIKDTLNIRPGEEYEVVFTADNKGNWMFHCHDLHHATAGMVTVVQYKGFDSGFTPDPNAGNQPE